MAELGFKAMAYERPEEIVFGRALSPVKCGFEVKIGGGEVVPELKYAPRPGKERDLVTLAAEYQRITKDILERALALGLPALVLDLKHVSQLTYNLGWGEEITKQTNKLMEDYHDKYRLRTALRITVADVRTPEAGMRSGEKLGLVLDSFCRCARAGADILSIESLEGRCVLT